MIRSCIRQAVRVFAGAAFFSCALAAQAGGITLNDSNCDSFSLTGSPGNQTLTCVVSNAPTGCSIQGPSTATNGSHITLTAVCSTGSPTTFAWSGGNCANNTSQSCDATDSNATRAYSVVISNAIGPGSPNPATKSVVWSTAVAVKPSGCSISADANPLPAGGGTVHLTANCTGGDAVDSWTWSGPTSISTGNTATASITTSSAFGVTATNGGGSGTASLAVSVSGGGGGGGPIACAGYLSTKVMTMNWPNWLANQNASMGPVDATVLVFTTGSTISSSPSASGQFYATPAPNANASTTHDFTLSTVPCDFGGLATSLKTLTSTGTAKIGFVIGQPTSKAINLQPNSTYYVNIRNSNDSYSCTVSNGSCDVNPVSLYKPN